MVSYDIIVIATRCWWLRWIWRDNNDHRTCNTACPLLLLLLLLLLLWLTM